jgi:hypothetical protein
LPRHCLWAVGGGGGSPSAPPRQALAVANKKVDAGAFDETVFQKMLTEEKINRLQVKVFYTTRFFFDDIWVARRATARDGGESRSVADKCEPRCAPTCTH